MPLLLFWVAHKWSSLSGPSAPRRRLYLPQVLAEIEGSSPWTQQVRNERVKRLIGSFKEDMWQIQKCNVCLILTSKYQITYTQERMYWKIVAYMSHIRWIPTSFKKKGHKLWLILINAWKKYMGNWGYFTLLMGGPITLFITAWGPPCNMTRVTSANLIQIHLDFGNKASFSTTWEWAMLADNPTPSNIYIIFIYKYIGYMGYCKDAVYIM